MQKYLSVAFIFILCACSGGEQTFLPKPKGYHRLEMPDHEYVQLAGDYPYTFELSKHTVVEPDKHFLARPSWIEIKYPQFGAEVDISYKPIAQQLDSLNGFIATSHKLTRKHSVKASSIEEYQARGGKKGELHAMVFELDGEVPSHFHFYAHDSTAHFLRAALYFNTSEKNDSLKPIIEYIKYDMMHMLNTLEWKEGKLKEKP
ncbi:MAG: gliding motility lipoprotein GldD [Flammeovirgaceae bacterium]